MSARRPRLDRPKLCRRITVLPATSRENPHADALGRASSRTASLPLNPQGFANVLFSCMYVRTPRHGTGAAHEQAAGTESGTGDEGATTQNK